MCCWNYNYYKMNCTRVKQQKKSLQLCHAAFFSIFLLTSSSPLIKHYISSNKKETKSAFWQNKNSVVLENGILGLQKSVYQRFCSLIITLDIIGHWRLYCAPKFMFFLLSWEKQQPPFSKHKTSHGAVSRSQRRRVLWRCFHTRDADVRLGFKLSFHPSQKLGRVPALCRFWEDGVKDV